MLGQMADHVETCTVILITCTENGHGPLIILCTRSMECTRFLLPIGIQVKKNVPYTVIALENYQESVFVSGNT